MLDPILKLRNMIFWRSEFYDGAMPNISIFIADHLIASLVVGMRILLKFLVAES